jgi:protein ImuB
MTPNLQPPTSNLYASLYAVASGDVPNVADVLQQVAAEFSPRYEIHGERLVTIDSRGLDRLIGTPRMIGEAMACEAARRGLSVHVALAGTQVAAQMLVRARPGITVVAPGGEAEALARIPLGMLQTIDTLDVADAAMAAVAHWGLRTLGEFAALPPGAVAARLGAAGVWWLRAAQGIDRRPLVPAVPEERFDGTLDLEWPIEGLEPLSFVLTRLFEPLSTRLERRDRGAAALYLALRLVTRDVHERRLELPAPMRDVRTLRTLLLLDLESHPPTAGVDRVTLTIEPTPGRILQHTLFSRPHPAPEQLSTLLARLGALMGQRRVGAPVTLDTYRPGAFAMAPFALEHAVQSSPPPASGHSPAGQVPLDCQPPISALRRYRQPVPARVVTDRDGRPLRLTTDRRAIAGGRVIRSAGPWRTSGAWWETPRAGSGQTGEEPAQAKAGWDRDEWDVALGDEVMYRVFRNRATGAWFIDAVVD